VDSLRICGLILRLAFAPLSVMVLLMLDLLEIAMRSQELSGEQITERVFVILRQQNIVYELDT
jgi:hypothetical protein